MRAFRLVALIGAAFLLSCFPGRPLFLPIRGLIVDAASAEPVENAMVWATRRLDGLSGSGGVNVQGWDHTAPSGKFWIHAKPNFPISIMLDHYQWRPRMWTFHPEFGLQFHGTSKQLWLVAEDWRRGRSSKDAVSSLCRYTWGNRLCQQLCRTAIGTEEPICDDPRNF